MYKAIPSATTASPPSREIRSPAARAAAVAVALSELVEVLAAEVDRVSAVGAAEAVRPVATLAVPVAVPVAVRIPLEAAEEEPSVPICAITAGVKVPVIPVNLRSYKPLS